MRFTISSTASSAVTALLLLTNFLAVAAPPKPCGVKRAQIPALRLDAKSVGKWSSDFLLQSILGIDDEYVPECPDPDATKISAAMKQEYLTRLGVKGDAELFYGLLAPQDDHPALKKRLRLQKPQATAEATLRALYGFAEKVRGVWVLGATSGAIAEMKHLLDAVCASDCEMWKLRKVLVTEAEGMAAYIPETASLVISASLLENPSTLTRVVVTHELAHVAAKRHPDWATAFLKFSGWKIDEHGGLVLKVETLGERPTDDLVKASETSRFSILPDPVLRAKGKDGFVLAKSYRETEQNHEPAEDMADAIAIYRWAPERFCFAGKPLAPQKFKWVEANVTFPAYKASLSCLKSR